jgi:hypothetical protein
MDGNQIAAMIEGSRILSFNRSYVSNEDAATMIEHAIDYLSGFGARYYSVNDKAVSLALQTLHEAHKAIGPLGQIPTWDDTDNAKSNNPR